MYPVCVLVLNLYAPKNINLTRLSLGCEAFPGVVFDLGGILDLSLYHEFKISLLGTLLV